GGLLIPPEAALLYAECKFPGIDAHRHKVGFVIVEILTPRRFLRLAGPMVTIVIAVEVNLVGRPSKTYALDRLFLECRQSCRRRERHIDVVMSLPLIRHSAGRDHAGPPDHAWHSYATFPGGALLAAEGRIASVRPEQQFKAVVGRVYDDRVVG